jgi:3-oxoacyl-[acyl-carrier-protein] synthase-3
MRVQSDGIKVIGSGSAISSQEVSNFELRAETAPWVSSRLGINTRRHLTENESLLELIVEAAEKSLKSANVSADQIDCIIIATSTPDYINPSMASILHQRIGAKTSCASFDLQAVCAGFVYALGLVASLVSANAGKYFLVIGADQFSRITDFTDRNCVFFGDGAGAILLEATEGDSFLAVELNTDGNGWKSFQTPRDTGQFLMNAKEVALSATTKLPDSIKSICSFIGKQVSDIDWFVTHQPSKPVLDALEASLNIPPSKLFRNISNRGNTAGATIPLLFDEIDMLHLAKPGDLICFSAIGAGWVWGSALLKWE